MSSGQRTDRRMDIKKLNVKLHQDNLGCRGQQPLCPCVCVCEKRERRGEEEETNGEEEKRR